MRIVKAALIVVALAIPVQRTHACCFPAKMEGIRVNLESQSTEQFVTDFNRGYIFLSSDPNGDTHVIIDLETRNIYTIEGDQCRKTPYPLLFSRCLKPGGKKLSGAKLGGGSNTLSMDSYKYKVDGVDGYFIVAPGDGDGSSDETQECFPVIMRNDLGRHVYTVAFYDVRVGVPHSDVFSHLSKCDVQVRS